MEEPTCGNCGAAGVLLCSRCRRVHYCTAACQKDAWKHHKAVCRTPTLDDVLLSESNGRPPFDASSFLQSIEELSDADPTAICKWLEAAAHEDSLDKFYPSCAALMGMLATTGRVFEISTAVLQFLRDSVRSAAITCTALDILIAAADHYTDEASPLLWQSIAILLSLLRTFIRDGPIVMAVCDIMTFVSHAAPKAENRLIFTSKSVLSLFSQAVDLHAINDQNGAAAALEVVTSLCMDSPEVLAAAASEGFVHLVMRVLSDHPGIVVPRLLRALCHLLGCLQAVPESRGIALRNGAHSRVLARLPEALEVPVHKLNPGAHVGCAVKAAQIIQTLLLLEGPYSPYIPFDAALGPFAAPAFARAVTAVARLPFPVDDIAPAALALLQCMVSIIISQKVDAVSAFVQHGGLNAVADAVVTFRDCRSAPVAALAMHISSLFVIAEQAL